jgi:hypothetical protein
MSAKVGEVFKPGQTCQQSGIYQVTHDNYHTETHEVTCVFGEPFPPCNHCGDHPRFRLVRLAQHISNNDHFKGRTQAWAVRR